jgi:SAM-dependent methyltransferase
MRDHDAAFVERLREQGKIEGPVLEVGAAFGRNCRAVIQDWMPYYTADRVACEAIDYVADFESEVKIDRLFGCILMLNTLEHTFEPIKVMDNTLRLLQPGGSLVLTAPAIWSLHEYPIDCWRLLPQFYERYAETRSLELETFEYLGYGPVTAFRNRKGRYQYPFAKWLLALRLFRSRLSIGVQLSRR